MEGYLVLIRSAELSLMYELDFIATISLIISLAASSLRKLLI